MTTADAPDKQAAPRRYEVFGGTGLRRIGRHLTREEAEKVKRDFDRDVQRYGLAVPRTIIREQP